MFVVIQWQWRFGEDITLARTCWSDNWHSCRSKMVSKDLELCKKRRKIVTVIEVSTSFFFGLV